MTSDAWHMVDPELHGYLRTLPTRAYSLQALEELRAAPRIPSPTGKAAAALAVQVDRQLIAVSSGPDVALQIYRPALKERTTGCIFHIHGGGYVCGEAALLEPIHRELAADVSCALVSVDYRLAPETVFPDNLTDCYAALCWVFDHAQQLGVDASRIGVMGESAGGGLAAALALFARDQGKVNLAFQHLVYPMLDDRTCTASDTHPHTGQFIWDLANNTFGWTALLGAPPGGDHVSQYAAAARAQDLSGLPRTFIATGALDLFLEENIEYARRLSRAGVPIELHVYPGAFHGFDMHPTARIACAARRDSLAALRRFLTRESCEL
jgi:acetyl esterase/lipase